ncbi:MAG: TolC family protein [Planctomycetes bacterium]|nr:TolC family protein [Planctomycetota bacterium]
MALVLAVLLAGCSSESYRKAADEEALAILHEKQEEVFGETRPFTVEPPPEDPARVALLEALAQARTDAEPAPVPLQLDLARSLEVAGLLGREFQNQKETLFVSALSLSNARWEFDWHPTLSGTVGIAGNRRDADVSTSASLTLDRALATGASILGRLLGSLSRSITSGVPWDRSALLTLGLTQPLLRGFGPDIALESLTQAERNVVYSLRSFERFRRRHVVVITADYYDLLQQLDRIDIEEANLRNLKVSFELQQALYEAGKLPKFQVDQNEQSVLSSEATLLRLRESLKSALDAFKITLGLPMDTELALARQEFADLQARGIPELALDPVRAVELALEHRLDLKISQDRVEDAKRQVVITADALRMGLDLHLDVIIPSKDDNAWQADWKTVSLGAALDWDLPIDRTRQRNAYRSAIITYERSVRDHELLLDTVKREVRARLRDLGQIEQDYKIQLRRVKLAVSQVDETNEKIRAGRAITRDLLEAQESLVSAQSALSRLLVSYKTAQLELLRDVEILTLDPEGLKYDDRLDTDRTAADARG